VKLMADGALGSRGAALHAPYCNDPDNRGLLLLPVDELEGENFLCIHAIGDRRHARLDATKA
jgi:predicted amidohydrolase YtcJ